MKIALVTGAGRELGNGFVQFLSSKGYHVYAGVRHIRARSKHSAITYIELDVTDDASIQRAITQIKAEQGKLDLIVNNAGLNKDTATNGHPEKAVSLGSLDRQILRTMFDVNAIGPLMIAKYAVGLMTGPNCFIINISSERASFGNIDQKGNYGYRASKAALNVFTQSLLFDLPKNVSTFAVHPGWVITEMNPNGVLKPTEAAEKIMRITDNWKPDLNGRFLNNDGSTWQD